MSQNGNSNLNPEVPDSSVNGNDSTCYLVPLPDVPLLLIFQNLPLQSLAIDLPLAHSRFLPLCDLLLGPNTRLTLYIGNLERIQQFVCSFRIGIPFVNYLGARNSKDPDYYRLHFLTLDEEKVDRLVTSMPAISHLEIVISQVNIYWLFQLIRLLTRWAPTLNSLKFACADFQPEDSQHLLTLIGEISLKLTALEHLTLDLDGELFGTEGNIPPILRSLHRLIKGNFPPGPVPDQEEVPQGNLDLPILGRLREFFFQTRDQSNLSVLLPTLERQAGEQLASIGLGFPLAWEPNPIDLNNNRPLAGRFTLLSTRYEPPFERNSFPNLKGYTANWHLNESLNSLTTRLSALEQLQYLELRRSPPNETLFENPFELPMPSVEILRIHFNNSLNLADDHTVLKDDDWAFFFPSVQIVNLIHLGDFCAECYPEEGEVNCSDKPPGFSQTSERMSCLSQLLAPLTELPKLRKIFYQRNSDLANIAEFDGKGVFVRTHAYIC